MSSKPFPSLLSHLDGMLDNYRRYTRKQLSRDVFNFYKWEFQVFDLFLRLQRCTTVEPNIQDDVTKRIKSMYLYGFSKLLRNEVFDIKKEIKAKYSLPGLSLPISSIIDGIPSTKFIAEFVQSVAENVPKQLPKSDYYSSLINSPETMDVVFKELDSLKKFVRFVSERLIILELQSQHHDAFFAHVLTVAGHTAMLFWLYLPDMAPPEISVLLSDFLRMRIKPIQPCIRKIYVDVLQSLKSTLLQSGWYPEIREEDAVESQASFVDTIVHNLMELSTNSNSTQVVALKDHLVSFQKMLNLLRAHINCVRDHEILHDIDTVIIDVGLLVYSLYDGEAEKKEAMAEGEVNTTLVLDLMGNIQYTNTMIYLTIRKAFQSNLPRIHGLGCVDFLLNNLKEFQSHHSNSLVSITTQIQIIQKELENLQPFLEAVAEERHNDLDNMQRCVTQLIDKAYEVEYILDGCIRNEAPVWSLERWLLDIIKEITLIKDEVAGVYKTKLFGDSTKTVTAQASSNLAGSPRMNEDFVGFAEVIEMLRNQLINGTRGRDVISIVGMPGLGKTTLAYRLYNDGLVISHFDIRAQCCVSQVYSLKDLFLAILHDIVGENSEHKKRPDELDEKKPDELAAELRKALFSKRYLILVDDVWETSAWDDLKGCFPDTNNGSRIIITTRNHDVSNYARFESEPLPLRMFSDDESWELLRKKAFGEVSCSPVLMNIGQQIAKNCGNLPLSIVLVAGILARTEKKEEYWEQVAKNLGAYIHKDSRAIIEQSYQILPYHLSSCFLYFGAFLEDSVINVSKLIRLWISNGFIKSCEGKSLEDIAEGYLENLIGRNLVMRTKTSSRGKIKACQIHDVLHDFCKERAKEKNLLLWIKRDQNSNHSSLVYCHKQHRISMSGNGYPIGEWSSCGSHVGSIISHTKYLKDDIIPHIFHSFRFLKVLDLGSTYIESFPTDLIYLRYFAGEARNLSTLSNITNCWNLETLLINNWLEETLPGALLEMGKLRHLHISRFRIEFENAEGILENSKKLYNLRTLSNPYFSCIRDAELLLSRTPNLHELRCRFNDYNFHDLKFPIRLETLKISGYLRGDLCFCISAPNLKQLTLVDLSLRHQRLSEIGLLQNLQVLKLHNLEIWRWKVRNGEFPQLKVLKLHKVYFIEEWIVEDEAFPNLERLVLRSCSYLKEIPSCFKEISSLKSIEVEDCDECVGKSARDIRETQVEDYQNVGFEVFICERENNSSVSGDDDSDCDCRDCRD